MPELPEVETYVQDLKRSGIEGKEIVRVRILWPKTFQGDARSVEGQKIVALERRGKFIQIRLKAGFLFIHLRMTGRFMFVNKSEPMTKHVHAVFELKGGHELRFHDTRKFGRISYTEDPETIIGNIGPEPLGLSEEEFYKRLHSKRRKLKALLLDQTFIAGLGNIYVDEALFESHLHPERLANTLTKKQVDKLLGAIKIVLERGLKTQGTSLGSGKSNYVRLGGQKGDHQNHLRVFRRTGKPCFECGTKIQRIIVSQRSTHFCSNCQK